MKKLYAIFSLAVLLILVSCQHEDIWDKLREHEERIEELERQCRQLNSNVEGIQKILSALQQNDYATEVMKIVEDGVEIGYSITFAKGGTVNIYHCANGSAPEIGVKMDEDGSYYWTCGNEWVTDDNGNKIAATIADPDGNYIIPLFRVSDDIWYVSYDNGNSWRVIEVEDGEGGVRHTAHGADRQRLGDGLHALLQGQTRGQHGGENLGGQRGKDAGFYTAAQTIGQHDHRRVLVRLHDVHMVAAELFTNVVDTLVADIRAKVIH